jgi:SAM-dependent methyltransferase
MRRRSLEQQSESLKWTDVFKGSGLDVGSGDDPMRPGDWPHCDLVSTLDLPDGAGDDVTQFIAPNEPFDFVHGSQVLEHAIDPAVMLRSWLKVLKPGGYIVATVPDWELYEKRSWPSHWNQGHRSTWSMSISNGDPGETFHKSERSAIDYHIKLPEWLSQFGADVIVCRLVTTNYDFNLPVTVDQTFDPDKGVECFIEMVLQKK